jgi:hypothetical protein
MLTFIEHNSDYLELSANVGSVFDIAARFPSMVFQKTPTRLKFFEFDDVFETSFWQDVRLIARACHDSRVDMLVVEPEASNYFERHFGYYGAAAIPVDTEPAEYRRLFSQAPPESPPDSLIHNGGILAFTGRSQSFGFWCERELEIGVIGLFDGPFATSASPLPASTSWKSADEALALMAPAFLARRVPADFASTLRSNYLRSS